jgi:DNA modification methylase
VSGPVTIGGCRLFHGDCLDVLRGMGEASVDSVVTDPPYHLTTGKKGGTGPASLNLNSPAGRSRVTTGFMGKRGTAATWRCGPRRGPRCCG